MSKEVIFNVEPINGEGKIYVQELKEGVVRGENVVVVTTEDGVIKDVTRLASPASLPTAAPAAETTVVPSASDAVADVSVTSDTLDATAQNKAHQEDGENTGQEGPGGGFSMKSLSRGLFGTKKRFKGRRNSPTRRKRSIRRNSPTRRNSVIRRKSKRAGKRR
jgi:hypothetical protein